MIDRNINLIYYNVKPQRSGFLWTNVRFLTIIHKTYLEYGRQVLGQKPTIENVSIKDQSKM